MSRPQKHPREVFLAIATIQISEKFQENVLTLRLKRSFAFGGFCRFLGSLETDKTLSYMGGITLQIKKQPFLDVLRN